MPEFSVDEREEDEGPGVGRTLSVAELGADDH